MEAKRPSAKTLAKYGLTASDWDAILERQGGVCAICEMLPKSGRLNVDHDHARGWKKMPPEKRAKHVRGLACFFCNLYYLGRGITAKRAYNVLRYLERYTLGV